MVLTCVLLMDDQKLVRWYLHFHPYKVWFICIDGKFEDLFYIQVYLFRIFAYIRSELMCILLWIGNLYPNLVTCIPIYTKNWFYMGKDAKSEDFRIKIDFLITFIFD